MRCLGLGRSSAADSSKFAQGISLALNATLLGLLIAIPALVSWSYYSRKVETFAVRMEALCDEFMRKHYRTEAAHSHSQAQADSVASVLRAGNASKLH